MMNVLDLLKYRLSVPGQQNDPVMDQFMQWGMTPRQSTPQLPPNYGEGEIMAPHPWYNPSIEEQERLVPLDSPERRENALNNELGFSRYLRQSPWPAPEGATAWLRPGQSPLASPLNQFLEFGRAPVSMY